MNLPLVSISIHVSSLYAYSYKILSQDPDLLQPSISITLARFYFPARLKVFYDTVPMQLSPLGKAWSG